jgi:ribonucleoside-diphosphate reductase alpha chain
MPRLPIPRSCPLVSASPFLDPSAVEAWDAWFRWRSDGELHDLTIEASWDRVATALAAAEASSAATAEWRCRIRQAIGDWQLLLDLRLLSSAGTGRCDWNDADLCAALNVAAFVRDPFSGWASFDGIAFRRCAELAVRALDNALLLTGQADGPPPQLRIGLIGLADALALLGRGYATPAGLEQARKIAALLAEATLAGSVRLAAERGARLPFDTEHRACAERRGIAAGVIADAERHGLRHAALTAVDSQPRLALLANHVADALDPLPEETDWQIIGDRHLRCSGFAHSLRKRHLLASGVALPPIDASQAPGIADQILLRAELAPWIDAPIDYPFRRSAKPDPAREAEWSALAAGRALPPLRWRDSSELDQG